jgi:hypothetical protein
MEKSLAWTTAVNFGPAPPPLSLPSRLEIEDLDTLLDGAPLYNYFLPSMLFLFFA